MQLTERSITTKGIVKSEFSQALDWLEIFMTGMSLLLFLIVNNAK
jgi:hypothetical protein